MTENILGKYNVVIVGSGFSGVVAASILADHDLDILLLDENLHVGGQLLRKIPEDLGKYANYQPDHVKKIGFRFVEAVEQKKVTILNRTCLAGVYEDNRLLLEIDRKTMRAVGYDTLLFATGARERYLPFKGWTLPGVYSAGMAQVLMKSSGVMPAKKMLIGGSGLFLFSVGYEFLKNKGKVLGILEQTGMFDKVKMVSQLFHQFAKFAEGGKFLSKIYLSGTPVRYRRKIIEARGDGQLEEVVIGKVDKDGRLLPGSEKVIATPALAVGYGFVPNVEGPQLAGCDLEYAADKGGWIVSSNDRLESSMENIFVAGEVTGVGGAFKSINEGKITAYSILERLGKIDGDTFQTHLRKLSAERKHHMKFVSYFNSLYQIPSGAITEIHDDAVVCRCEQVTMKEVKEAVAAGYNESGSLKTAVRCAMGNCQGRTCGPMVFDIMNTLSDSPHPHPGTFSARPPLKPVTLEALINYKEN